MSEAMILHELLLTVYRLLELVYYLMVCITIIIVICVLGCTASEIIQSVNQVRKRKAAQDKTSKKGGINHDNTRIVISATARAEKEQCGAREIKGSSEY